MDAAVEIGRNSVSNHRIQPVSMSRLTRDRNPSPENKFSGANGDREIFIFPVQLTKSETSNLITRWVHDLMLYGMTITNRKIVISASRPSR